MIIKIIMLLEGSRKDNKKVGILTLGSVHASFSEVSLGVFPSLGSIDKGSETTSEPGCKIVTFHPVAALTRFPWAALG